jgi:hypothetical protein
LHPEDDGDSELLACWSRDIPLLEGISFSLSSALFSFRFSTKFEDDLVLIGESA